MENSKAKIILQKIMRVERVHRSFLNECVSEYNINMSQHALLKFLILSCETPTQKQVSDMFEISPAAVAVMMKKLEKMKLIERIINESDVRKKYVSITQKGRDVMANNKKFFDYIDNEMLKDIDAEDLKVFSKVLNKITDNILNLNSTKNNQSDMLLEHDEKTLKINKGKKYEILD